MTSRALNWRAEEEQAWQATDSCGVDSQVDEGEHLFNITRDPRVMGGAAVIAGTRIPVFMIEDLYNEAPTVSSILAYYPRLNAGQVLAALAYAEVFAGIVAEDRASYEAAAARAYGA